MSGSRSVESDSLGPHGLYSPRTSPGHNTRVGWPFTSPGDLPNPGIKPRSPALQVDSLPAEPPGKPKNSGVGSLYLLQQIFLTQKSNWSLLHCRQFLYQLSYQRSPYIYLYIFIFFPIMFVVILVFHMVRDCCSTLMRGVAFMYAWAKPSCNCPGRVTLTRGLVRVSYLESLMAVLSFLSLT